MAVGKSWQYTLVGLSTGLVVSAALYLFSADAVIALFVSAVEKVLNIVVGLIRLKSH